MIFKKSFQNFISVMFTKKPFIIYHKPTTRCDCKCVFCDFWIDQSDEILPTEQILTFLEKAAKAGFSNYTALGGEPLLCPDLPKWLKYAKKEGMLTGICTTGLMLEKRSNEIIPYIDNLFLSIEAIGEKLDEMRGVKGLFQAVCRGIESMKNDYKGNIIIWCNITKDNMKEIENIARFANSNRIFVQYFPAAVFKGYNEKIVLNPEEKKEVFSKIIDLKKKGYPIISSYAGLKLIKEDLPFKCNQPKNAIVVEADGTIYPCVHSFTPIKDDIGNIKNDDWTEVFNTKKFRKIQKDLEKCNNCLLPCAAEIANNYIEKAVIKTFNNFYFKHFYRHLEK